MPRSKSDPIELSLLQRAHSAHERARTLREIAACLNDPFARERLLRQAERWSDLAVAELAICDTRPPHPPIT